MPVMNIGVTGFTQDMSPHFRLADNCWSFKLASGQWKVDFVQAIVMNTAASDLPQVLQTFFLYIWSGVRICFSVFLNVSPLPSMERKKQDW